MGEDVEKTKHLKKEQRDIENNKRPFNIAEEKAMKVKNFKAERENRISKEIEEKKIQREKNENKRMEWNKKLKTRTKRGQVNLNNHVSYLLEKIEKKY